MNTMYRIIIFIICNLVYTSHVFSQSPAKNVTQFYEEGLKFKNETKCNEAIVSYKKALKLKPDHKESLYETGWCYNELGKSEEALTYLLQAKKVWGNEPKVFLETGYAYYQLKKDTDAILNYNKCLELNNEYSLAYKYLGDVYYSRQDYSKALENYKLYIVHADKISSATFYYKKGYAENELEKYNDAIASFEKSVELKDNDPKNFDEMGFAYYKLKDADNSIKQYNRSLSIKPDSYVPYLGIGDVNRILKKNTDEALTNYLKAIKNNPESKKAQYSAGWCYNAKQEYNNAIGYLKKALELDKDYISASTELGYSYYSMGEYSNALALFEKSISIDPKNSLAHYYAGLCYISQKNKESALKKNKILEEIKSPLADKLKAKIEKM